MSRIATNFPSCPTYKKCSVQREGREEEGRRGEERSKDFTLSLCCQVRAVVPSSGPLGSVIEIGGYRFQSSLNRYERFFLGGSICDPRAPGTNAQYGGRWRWPLYYAKCITTEQQVGGWNASAFLRAGYSRGASWNHSEALYPMHDWKLAMYELFPGEEDVTVYVLIGR